MPEILPIGQKNYFVDLFATYICGPAYAYSHLYLSTKRENDPNRISLFTIDPHPNDEARMYTILSGLKLLRCNSEKKNIGLKWQNYLSLCETEKSSYQNHAYPPHLLKKCAQLAFEGFEAIGCQVYSEESLPGTIAGDLNNAWETFWSSPHTYSDWEGKKVEEMKSKLGFHFSDM